MPAPHLRSPQVLWPLQMLWLLQPPFPPQRLPPLRVLPPHRVLWLQQSLPPLPPQVLAGFYDRHGVHLDGNR